MNLLFYLFPLLSPVFSGPEKTAAKPYLTQNVVVVVIDGPRFSETWGGKNQELIPRLAGEMAAQGIVNTNFRNEGPTYTLAGHTAITTGVYQQINNGGFKIPRQPSYLQRWLQKTGAPTQKAWIVTSKDKLAVLAQTQNKKFRGKFQPETNCGINGFGTGYRQDSITLAKSLEILQKHQPNLLLVNFKEPDDSGHRGDWPGYLAGIKSSDEYAYQLWKFLQTDAHYRGKTTFILTNDHGRHHDGRRDGFVSHGDNCKSCRHILFYASGPDFQQNKILNKRYGQTDIPATISELLGFEMPTEGGDVMQELFIDQVKKR